MINRNALLIITGRLFTSYGYYLVVPFLMIYIIQYLDISPIRAGFLLAILNLSRRGLGIIAGYLSDKFGSRNTMLVGLALEVFAYTGINLVKNFWLLAIIIFMSGAGGCFYNVSSRSILATAKMAKGAAIGFGLFYITMHIGALLGPITYLWFVKKGIIGASFYISAILYALFLVASIIWLKQPQSENISINIKDLLAIFLVRPFMSYCILITGAWFVINQLYVVLPLYVLHIKNGVQLIAYLNAWNAILVIGLQYWCSRVVEKMNTFNRFNLLAFGILLMGLGWFFYIIPGEYMLYFAICVFTLGEIMFISVVDLLALTFAPQGQSGLYLGFTTFTWAIGGALASIVGATFYPWLVNAQHSNWFWIGLLSVSMLLSIFILASRTKLIESTLSPQTL